jgi:hypothetical protein
MDIRRFAIGSVVLLLVGCIGTGGATGAGSTPLASSPPTLTPVTPQASEAAGIVPWSSAIPASPTTHSPTPAPSGAACRADQLAAGNAGWGGATGSLLGGFLVWNTSVTPCDIEGSPSVAIVDGAGHALKIVESTMPSPPSQPIVLTPGQSAPPVNEDSPSGLASETFQWFNWCGTAPKAPLSLAVTLNDIGVLRLHLLLGAGDTSAPRCDEPASPSTLTVSAFEATTGPEPSDPPAVPAEGLRLALEVPDHATAGETLQYVAALTNPSSSAIALSPCPAYRETLAWSGESLVEEHLLNCDAVPSIGPGQTVRFAMVLDIPARQWPRDSAAIIWELDPWYGDGFPPRSPAQKVPIRIVAP